MFKDQEDKDGKITISINKTKEVIFMIIINRIIVIRIGTIGIILTNMKDFGKGMGWDVCVIEGRVTFIR